MRKKVLIFNFIIGLFLALVVILLPDGSRIVGQGPGFMELLSFFLVSISFELLILVSTGLVALVNDAILIAFINGLLCAVFGYVGILICEKTKLKERIKLVWFIPASVVLFEGINLLYGWYLFA